MSTTIVQEQATVYQYTPLTTQRMCRSEIAQLSEEIRRAERLSKFDAECEALQLLAELREYADDWDAWAFKQGSPAGLPF